MSALLGLQCPCYTSIHLSTIHTANRRPLRPRGRRDRDRPNLLAGYPIVPHHGGMAFVDVALYAAQFVISPLWPFEITIYSLNQYSAWILPLVRKCHTCHPEHVTRSISVALGRPAPFLTHLHQKFLPPPPESVLAELRRRRTLLQQTSSICYSRFP